MKTTSFAGKLIVWSLVTISGVAFGHETASHETNHQNFDRFLARMVRAEEQSGRAKISKYIDHTLEKLPETLLFSEIVDATIGKQAIAADSNNPALSGQWSALTTWPFAFASAANLPDGRILAWGGNHQKSFNGGTYTYAAVWDPSSGFITEKDNTTHSMFCGVPVMLEDGRVFVDGGNGKDSDFSTSTFDFHSQSWTHHTLDNLAVGRWYNGSVFMPNGQVFSALGEPGSNYPELWTEGVGWSYMNGINFQDAVLKFPTLTEPKNWLPHLHLSPNGKIFHSGHTPQINYIDIAGAGSIQPVGLSNNWNTANTPSVFYDEGKILQAGGRLFNTLSAQGSTILGKPTTKSELFDLNLGAPSLTLNTEMHYPRIFNNEVVLPNGEVMVIGGNNGTKFSDTLSQMTPEIWNPVTKTWRLMSNIAVPRNYHSVALLMTDGRVWSGGGGLCDCSADHPDSQVFSPPYLFNADGSLATRPEITQAPSTVSFGNSVTVTANVGISRFTLIRMSSSTHTLNSDMRFLNVPFETQGNGEYSLTFHTNRNVMVPGYWMLFAINSAGVPSIAKVINVSTSTAPVVNHLSDTYAIQDKPVNLAIQATDPNGDTLSYTALGLPKGLEISPTTGIITGQPSQLGNNRVTILVSDQNSTASTSFVWNVVPDRVIQSSAIVGSSVGDVFTDNVQNYQKLVGINLYSGDWVDSLQGILNSAKTAVHGSSTSTLTAITWPENEYLVRVYSLYGDNNGSCSVTCGHQIGQITFVTNTGRILGPYGTGAGNSSQSFDLSAPAGQEIIGFTGRADSSLTALGLLYQSHIDINHPPFISAIPNQVNNVGGLVNVAVLATDPDGDSLTYSATDLPAGIVINSTTGLMTGSPTVAKTGTVTIQVNDSRGGVASTTFKWDTTLELPLAINLVSTAPQTINTPITLTGSSSNGVNPRYKWSFGDGTPESDYSSNPVVQHSYTNPGLYIVRVTVTDDRGIAKSQTFVQAVHLPLTAKLPKFSSNMAASVVGTTHVIWVVNKDSDSVSIFDAKTDAKLAEIPVGIAPRSIAIAPDGKAWVSNKGGSSITVINQTTRKIQKTIALPIGSQPFGIAFSPDNNFAYVVLEATGKILKLVPSTGVIKTTLDVGANPRHVSVSSDSTKVYVSRFISPPLPGESTANVLSFDSQGKPAGGEIVVLSAPTIKVIGKIVLQNSDKEDTETQGSGLPNYLAMLAISPDGQTAWLPSKQDNVMRGMLRNGNNLNFQNTVRGINSKIDLISGAENYDSRIDFDNSGVATAATYDPSGNYLFVTLQTSREISVIDAYGGRELRRIAVGLAPDGLVVSPDGKKLYVSNYMDRSVSVIDISGLLARGEWQAPVIKTMTSSSIEKLPAQVLKGKQLFYDAKDPRLAKDSYLSCAACHDDAGHDGRVWDLTGFGEGLRNTIPLSGRSGKSHGRLHWTGNFDEIQDFEGQIRKLASGSGLMKDSDFTATQDTLGLPKAGLSSDLDALAAYAASLNSFKESPYRNSNGTLTTEALAGKTLFNVAGCLQCHQNEAYTDSPMLLVHDIGTIKPSSGLRLNTPITGFDTPTLRDVWNTAPYLHDGSASTLQNAIKAHNTVKLSDGQINQLASYLQQIGGTEGAAINQPPVINITTPVNNLVFLEGGSIQLGAEAFDADGMVSKVEFYANNILIGTLASGPYVMSWSGAISGSYVITAKAYDNYGLVTTSNIINLNVISSLAN